MTAYGNEVTSPKLSHTEPSQTSQISSAQFRVNSEPAQLNTEWFLSTWTSPSYNMCFSHLLPSTKPLQISVAENRTNLLFLVILWAGYSSVRGFSRRYLLGSVKVAAFSQKLGGGRNPQDAAAISVQQQAALLHDDGWLPRQRKGKLPALLRCGPQAPREFVPWYPIRASHKASPIEGNRIYFWWTERHAHTRWEELMTTPLETSYRAMVLPTHNEKLVTSACLCESPLLNKKRAGKTRSSAYPGPAVTCFHLLCFI